jgi:hypothetical protein
VDILATLPDGRLKKISSISGKYFSYTKFKQAVRPTASPSKYAPEDISPALRKAQGVTLTIQVLKLRISGAIPPFICLHEAVLNYPLKPTGYLMQQQV